jgi:hypothetical protein
MYIGHGHGGMRSATSVGNGGGYMTIPENEGERGPHSSNFISIAQGLYT